MTIRSSGRRRPAAKWRGPFTQRSYGSTDDRVATLPGCMLLAAARARDRCQRRRGRRRGVFGAVLEETIRDKTVMGKKLAVKRFAKIQDAANSHILFLSSSEESRLSQMM